MCKINYFYFVSNWTKFKRYWGQSEPNEWLWNSNKKSRTMSKNRLYTRLSWLRLANGILIKLELHFNYVVVFPMSWTIICLVDQAHDLFQAPHTNVMRDENAKFLFHSATCCIGILCSKCNIYLLITILSRSFTPLLLSQLFCFFLWLIYTFL